MRPSLSENETYTADDCRVPFVAVRNLREKSNWHTIAPQGGASYLSATKIDSKFVTDCRCLLVGDRPIRLTRNMRL